MIMEFESEDIAMLDVRAAIDLICIHNADLILRYVGLNPSARVSDAISDGLPLWMPISLINIVTEYTELTESEHVARMLVNSDVTNSISWDEVFDEDHEYESAWMVIGKDEKWGYYINFSDKCAMYEPKIFVSLNELAPSERLMSIRVKPKYQYALDFYRDIYVRDMQNWIDLY